MLVSYQWLNEYVDISSVSPHELADKMSRTGIEVEEVTVPFEGLKKIVVGYISECTPHPDSDHLSVCQVDIGESELLQIVCGAPNVTKGKKVIVALPGARIVDNTKIKKGKIRGQVSNGMLCSLQELGYKDSLIPKDYADGIFFLPEDSTVGESVFPLLSMEDSIIELSITPNRADALSMRGVAYEVGAIYKKQPAFDSKELKENSETKIEDKVTISIEDNQDAPIYKMRIIENVQIKESPLWLQMRLINAGVRPINNVVDVTNYILLYYGQPMHAFDFDKVSSNKINVRRANQDEQLVTLDGQERTLSTEDVVITDGSKPIALAGVMGGLNSEIDKNTTTVALESAVFDSTLVRKTSKKFNLRSESSSRFEKGINEGTVAEACDYAASMICELAGGKIVQGMAIGSDKKLTPVTVDVSESEINRLLGTNLSIKGISDIFVALGFPYEESTGEFCITIPSRRWDITIAADIIEEVARIYGYDNIPSTLPKNVSIPGELTQGQKIIRKTKEILEGSGVSEVISHALTTEKKATEFSLNKNTPVAIDWPMSEDRSFLRMNVTSGLLDDVSYNFARKNNNLAFFEIGHVFSVVDNNKQLPEEREHLGIALIGDWKSKDWDETQEKVDFYLLKGIMESLFTNLGILKDIEFKPSSTLTSMHPGRTASIFYKENLIGFIGQVHPKTSNEYDVSEVYVCEIDLTYIIDNYSTTTVYKAVSKFPSVKRDIALLSDKSVLNSDIIEMIKSNGGKYLKNVTLFDLYEGENLSNNKKSLAYSLTFQNEESTMTEEDITKGMNKISKALEENLNITIR